MLFFFSSRRRHTRLQGDWSSDVCSSDLDVPRLAKKIARPVRYIRFGCWSLSRCRHSHSYLRKEIRQDRKSTRLNSSHLVISYAVFCLKKKKKNITFTPTHMCMNLSSHCV